MPKTKTGAPTYRDKRPVDLIAAEKPSGQRPSLKDIPEAWQVAVTEAEEWPYVDPDENGLADPDPSFNDYPSDPESLPAEIEPFSEDEPWGQMLNETAREYEFFSHFRSQGITRTKRATARHFEVTPTHISTIATNRNWDARIKAWDDFRERVYTMELILGVKEMAHKHAEIAREGVEALATAFSGIVENMKDEEKKAEFLAEIADLPVKTQLALAQGSARVIPNLMNAERLSRGLPTEISHELHSHEARVTIQTTDDLYDIITAVVGPLAVARSEGVEEEVIEPES